MRSRAFPRIPQISLPLLLLVAPLLPAQGPPNTGSWAVRTRAFISGGSHASDPGGYKAYSGLGLEAQIDRQLSTAFGVSLTLRTESREIDSVPRQGPARRLGSIESLPLSLLVQYRLGRAGIQPYVGLGGNLTVAWEKSGSLDSLDVKASVGPVIQAGVDLQISPRGMLTFDARWNSQRLRVWRQTSRLFTIKVDPLTLGLGVGLKF
jgi:outer membrane protein W